MDRPLASVHLITYNHKPYIAQAIEGILRQQTSFPFEIVIGEDRSTDGTREIVFDYSRKHPGRIRVAASDRNVGANANSARIHAACSGKYIAYCDGDDWWHHPQKLQKQVDYLEAHPKVGLVHSDYDRHCPEEGTIIRNFTKAYRKVRLNGVGDVFGAILLGNYWVATSTVCARRSLVERARREVKDILEAPDVLLGDLPCWLSMCRLGEFFFLEESLATYRRLRESASQHRSRTEGLRFHESSQRVRLLLAEKYGAPQAIRDAVSAQYYTVLLNSAYHLGDGDLARYAFGKLQELENGVSLSHRLYLLGATSQLVRGSISPLLRLRRSIRQIHRAYCVGKCRNVL